jgi:hypothetical protein
MPDGLEVIKTVLSQHFKITENIKNTGDKMNDVDAVFGVQVAAYQTAQSAFSVSNLLEKRDQLLHTINILGDGLQKHFDYEEKVLPLVFGELLLKDILHDHKKIFGQIENVKTTLIDLEKLSHNELLSKRLELIQSVNELSSIVVNHAHYEETVLNMIKKVFEEKPAHPD